MLFFAYRLLVYEIVSQQSELFIFRCVASAAHFFILEERKMTKKLLSVLLTAAMALSLTACGENAEILDVTDNSTSAEATTTEKAETTTKEQTEATTEEETTEETV